MERTKFLRLLAGVGSIDAASTGFRFLIGVYLARLFGPADYGNYVFLNTLIGLGVTFSLFGLAELVVRELASKRGSNGEIAPSERNLILRSTVVSLVFSVTLGVAYVLWMFLSSPSFDPVVVWAALALIPTALMQLSGAILSGLNRIQLSTFLSRLLPSAAIFFGLLTLGWIFPKNLDWVFIQRTIFSLIFFVVCLFFIILTVKKYRENIENKEERFDFISLTWEMLKKSSPFIMISGAMLLNSRVDVIMLGVMAEEQEVGIYGVAVQGALLVTLLSQVQMTAFRPRFAHHYARGEVTELRRVFRLCQIVGTLAAVACVGVYAIFGMDLINLIFGQEFLNAYWPLVIVSLGYLGNSLFGPVGALAQMIGQEKMTLYILLSTGIGNVVLNAILIPAYGALGASIATAIAATLFHMILTFPTQRALR